MENRTERVVIETARYRIAGDLTLPREGYRSRVSEYLNQGEIRFLALTDVEATPHGAGETVKRPFMAVSVEHIEVAYGPESPEPSA